MDNTSSAQLRNAFIAPQSTADAAAPAIMNISLYAAIRKRGGIIITQTAIIISGLPFCIKKDRT